MKVLVTGANGHVGFSLTTALVERGHQVRVSMRNAADAEKSGPLRKLGVEIVEADVLAAPSMERAAAGMEGLFHVAAVYKLVVKDPDKELMQPSLQGAENAVRAAKKAGVRRVVLTSSCVAVGTRRSSPDRALDERDWNDNAVGAYPLAKTRAERRAGELGKELGVDVVAINPTGVLGPGFYRHTPSTGPIRAILNGEMPAAPPIRLGYVDVRDVASAHILAMETAGANGRYLVHTRCLDLIELARLVKLHEPSARVPSMVLPTWTMPMIRAVDWVMHKTMGLPRQISQEMADEFGDLTLDYDASRAQRELGWKPRPFEQTIADTVHWIQTQKPPMWT